MSENEKNITVVKVKNGTWHVLASESAGKVRTKGQITHTNARGLLVHNGQAKTFAASFVVIEKVSIADLFAHLSPR